MVTRTMGATRSDGRRFLGSFRVGGKHRQYLLGVMRLARGAFDGVRVDFIGGKQLLEDPVTIFAPKFVYWHFDPAKKR